jgi:CheY-like chemotaxis protein
MQSSAILYAEDENNDVFFLDLAIKMAGAPWVLNAVADGEQAIDYLTGEGPFADRARHPLPALVLLDINMPRKSGLEVLEWIRQQRCFESLPVLMLTSSSRSEDREKARLLGANDYLLKPSDPRTLIDVVNSIHDRWLPAEHSQLSAGRRKK